MISNIALYVICIIIVILISVYIARKCSSKEKNMNREKKSNTKIITAAIVVSIAVLIWGLIFLNGRWLLGPSFARRRASIGFEGKDPENNEIQQQYGRIDINEKESWEDVEAEDVKEEYKSMFMLLRSESIDEMRTYLKKMKFESRESKG